MSQRLPIFFTLALFTAAAAHSQNKAEVIGEGTIVAFQKHERHPAKAYSARSFATPVDVWIVRIDRWNTDTRSRGYFLVNYVALHERALTDTEINRQRWRFSVRDPIFHEAKDCAGRVPVPQDGGSYDWRPAQMGDFQLTRFGTSEAIPPLADLPCLVVERPPTSLGARSLR